MSTYSLEETQNLAKFYHPEDGSAAMNAHSAGYTPPEHSNVPKNPYLRYNSIHFGTSPTRSTMGQFRRPGLIDGRYDEPSPQTEAISRISVSQVGWLPTLLTQESQTTRVMANPPYARHRPTPVALIRQYVILLRFLLAEYRSTWFIHLIGGLLIPISLAFVIVAVGGVTNRDSAIYLFGGNLAMSIATGPAGFLIGKIGWARQSKEFDCWIALPISKLLLIFALISVALIFALPGILCIYVFGSLLIGLPFSGTWALIPLIPLGALPLAGLGALLGILVPNGETAGVVANILILFIGVLSPVMLPLESLPVPLRIVAQFMPTTYVADAFRAVLGGPGTYLTLDLIILVVFSAVLLTITYFRMDWRST